MASVFVSSPSEVVLIDSRTRQGTLTLPLTNAIPYRVLNFKDQYGTFSNSTLTLSTQVGESFDDGTTSKTFSNAFGAAQLYAISSKWMVLNATTTVQQTISSLTVNQLTFGTGAGWVQFGPVQATVVSSIQSQTQTAYVNNLLLGNTSTVTAAQYAGLFNTYTNTVLAEISTGAGTQEFLVFKGSSTSDRVRVQTTGAFVVETGVSARLWNSNTTATLSNVTPAFVITTSSNVGIQTASPQATLDVAGTGRFQVLSTLNINLSTINGQVFGAPITSTSVGLGTLGYISTASLISTTQGLQEYVSSFIDPTELASSILPFISSTYFTTSLTSTIDGLGSAGYVSTLSMNSSIASAISSLSTAYGTVGGGGLTTLPSTVSTFAFLTSSMTTSTLQAITISTANLTLSSLTFVDARNFNSTNTLTVQSTFLYFNNTILGGTRQLQPQSFLF